MSWIFIILGYLLFFSVICLGIRLFRVYHAPRWLWVIGIGIVCLGLGWPDYGIPLGVLTEVGLIIWGFHKETDKMS